MTGGESSQVLARFEHAVPLAREIVWASLACDAVGNAARNDQCLGMREHARLGQHQWHVRLPATGKWNCRYVADGVNIFIPGGQRRAVNRDPSALVGQSGFPHYPRAAMWWHRYEQVVCNGLFAFEGNRARRRIHPREFLQGMECNPAVLDRLSNRTPKFWPGDGHGQGFRCKQVKVHFISQPASLEEVCNEHRALIGRSGTLERKPSDDDGEFASAKVA